MVSSRVLLSMQCPALAVVEVLVDEILQVATEVLAGEFSGVIDVVIEENTGP